MVAAITKEDIINILNHVEHPEINASLVEIGMILDISVDNDKNIVNIALGLPVNTIPQAVEKALIENIEKVLSQINLKTKIHFFDMPEEQRSKFFNIAKAKWKHS